MTNTYPKWQKIVAWIMFLWINILFYIKYLSKVSPWIALIGCICYLGFVFCVIKFQPSLRRKSWISWILGIVLVACGVLLYFVPKELFTADRWEIVKTYWDAIANGIYPYAQYSPHHNLPGAMPFYFAVCYPFHCMDEIGFMGIIAVILLTMYYRRQDVKTYSLYFLLLLSSLCIYWEIFARSTILINAVLFLFFFYWIQDLGNLSRGQWIASAVVGGLLFSMRNVFVLPLLVWGMYQLVVRKYPFGKMVGYVSIFIITFALTFLPLILKYPTEFLTINPFITQSSLVPTIWIVIFAVLALIIGAFCKNNSDVMFYSTLLLFGIVTVHFAVAIYENNFAASIFSHCADISYYLFCFPFLLHILTAHPLPCVESK